MKQKEQDRERLLKDYLLGKLEGCEELSLEERYLSDAELQDELLSVEAELIDRYLDKELSATEEKAFETRFLSSPRGRSKVEFVRSLRIVASEPMNSITGSSKSKRQRLRFLARSPIRLTFLAVALALLLALAYSIKGRFGYDHRKDLAAHMENQHPSSSPAKPENAEPGVTIGQASPPAALATIVLEPVSRDAIRSRQVEIHSSTQQLRIALVLEGNRKSYSVTLLNAEDQVQWRARGLRPQPTPSGQTLLLALPATLFKNGEYTVLLNTDDTPPIPIAEYSFSVYKN